MNQEVHEVHPVIKELVDFCNRNLGNRLTVDLCESVVNKVSAALQPQLTSSAREAAKIRSIKAQQQEAGNAQS